MQPVATASQAQTADSVSLLFSGSLLSPTFRALKFLFYFFLHLSLCSLLLICQNLTILSQSCGGSNGHSLKVASEKLDFPQATGKVLGRKPVPRLSARRSRSREEDRHSAHPDAPGRHGAGPPPLTLLEGRRCWRKRPCASAQADRRSGCSLCRGRPSSRLPPWPRSTSADETSFC